MQSLLRWGIENSTSSGPSNPPVPNNHLNPEIIDLILGESEADQMKKDVATAVDVERSESERVDALDHLEMLIEQIDNANNLEKLKLWEPLHSLLTAESSTDPIILNVIWVIGTAVQNNPAAQDSYLALNPLPTLTSFLSPSISSSPQTRSKVIYALSGLLKHNAPALALLDNPETDGWAKLRQALQDPDITVRRKVAFLLNTLLIPNSPHSSSSSSEAQNNLHTPDSQQAPVHPNSHASHLMHPDRTATSSLTFEAMQKYGILPVLIDGLTNPLPFGADGDNEEADVDFEEKSVGVLRTYAVACGGEFDHSQKDTLRKWVVKEKSRHGSLAERWGLSESELEDFVKNVESG